MRVWEIAGCGYFGGRGNGKGYSTPEIFGSRALSFKRLLLSVDVNVCLYVRNFEVKHLGNERSWG